MSEWGGHTRETRKATQVAPTRVLGTGVVKGTWDLRSWGRVTWETGVEEGPEECPNRSNRKKRFLRIFVPSKARATSTNAEHGDEEMLTERGVNSQTSRAFVNQKPEMQWYKRRCQKGEFEERISKVLSTHSVAIQDFPLRDTRNPCSQVRTLHSPDMQATFQVLGMLEQSWPAAPWMPQPPQKLVSF